MKHKVYCGKINEGALTMPDDEHKFVKFRNYQNTLRKTHVIYSDVETILKKNLDINDANILQIHEVYSIGLFLQNSMNNDQSFYSYNYGDDVLEWFSLELLRIADIVQKVSLLKNTLLVKKKLHYYDYRISKKIWT